MSVRDHDERWDELALGHVLGGLPAAEASSFRTHLTSCDQCRARVAELRSLDSEMARAVREEQAGRRERQQHRAATRTDDRARRPAAAAPVRPRLRTVIAVAVIALLLGGLSVWNAHLRGQNAYLTRVAESQDEVLGVLGRGTVVPVTTSGQVSGVVSVDGDQVAYALAEVPQPEAGQRLVVWIRGGDVARAVQDLPPAALAEGVLRSTVQAPDADGLLITIEPDPVPGAPSGRVVLEADLPGAPPQPS